MIVQVACSSATITNAAMHPRTVYNLTSDNWKKDASLLLVESSGAATTKNIKFEKIFNTLENLFFLTSEWLKV